MININSKLHVYILKAKVILQRKSLWITHRNFIRFLLCTLCRGPNISPIKKSNIVGDKALDMT